MKNKTNPDKVNTTKFKVSDRVKGICRSVDESGEIVSHPFDGVITNDFNDGSYTVISSDSEREYLVELYDMCEMELDN